MNLISIYEGLADLHRLRIVHLLAHGPLGVKHLQGILGISQVRVSKHLAYLRIRGLVEVDRHQNWMLYRLPVSPAPELAANLKCLTECVHAVDPFQADLQARAALQGEVHRVTQLGMSPKRRATEVLPAPAAETVPVGGVGWGVNSDSGYID